MCPGTHQPNLVFATYLVGRNRLAGGKGSCEAHQRGLEVRAKPENESERSRCSVGREAGKEDLGM